MYMLLFEADQECTLSASMRDSSGMYYICFYERQFRNVLYLLLLEPVQECTVHVFGHIDVSCL